MIKVKCDSAVNATALWLEALHQAMKNNDREIYFARGTYHFYSEGSTLKHCFVSNNDASVKNIVFYLNNVNKLRIYGDDAHFVFHGRLSPFVLENCTDILIEGISIDFADRFSYEAYAVDSDGSSVLMQLDGRFRIENGKFRVFDDGLDNMTGKLIFTAFNPENNDILPCGSYHIDNQNLVSAGDGLVQVPMQLRNNEKDFFVRHQARYTPAVVIDCSCDTVLRNVYIHHAEGMGVVGQNSENILLENVNVIPAENYRLAVTDDAVHFSECSGSLELRNCVFHHTLDDAVNIHGMYRRMRKIGDVLLLEACHFQQFGLWNGKDGDKLELLKCATLEPYAEVRVKHFSQGTRQLYCVELEDELPAEFEDRDMARIMRSAASRVVISNCDIANNQFRGILVSGTENALIENCKIHSPGHGIYLSGDANYWYESGPNKNVEICNNIFDGCTYCAADTYPICVDPVIPQPKRGFYYHGKLKVHDNIFRACGNAPVLKAHSLAELEFVNNQLPSGVVNAVDADCPSVIIK